MRTVSPSVSLTRAAALAVRRGHPWVWRQGVTSGIDRLLPGDAVRVLSPEGARLGYALADPGSPIVLRIWGKTPLDPASFSQRVERAVALRERLFANGLTTAYRVVHGEGDRMPGLVVDRYGPVAVLRTDGDGIRRRLGELVEALRVPLARLGIVTIIERVGTRKESHVVVLHGEPPPERLEVQEHGVSFMVDLARGQKTGAFLDQRENRVRVGALAAEKRVLNLFSYTGGFSLWAARGGAIRVTSVDLSAEALATGEESFRRAGLDPRAHLFVAAEAFGFLSDAKRRGLSWDLIVSDPPSFAPREQSVERALGAYRTLHRACVELLAPGGLFCAASCSSHVNAEAFVTTLDDAALGRDDLRLLELIGAPADHPTLPGWPEGRYLKFAILG